MTTEVLLHRIEFERETLTAEEAVPYGWNYAHLLAKGRSLDALVPSPIMRGMRKGRIARVEELTRIPADVQDARSSPSFRKRRCPFPNSATTRLR